MFGIFQNTDPHPPHRPASVYPPPHLVRREDTLAGWRGGWEVNILEDAKHSSVLYICKYFVVKCVSIGTCFSLEFLCEKFDKKTPTV